MNAYADEQLNDTSIEELADFDIRHVIHPQFNVADHRDAVIYARGEGAVLTDVHGKQYIDGLSSLWNVAVGHGRRELAEAAAQQMTQLAFSNSYTGYANAPSIQLAEKLLSLVYPNMSGIFYANSGSEANDMAMKAARYFWFVSGQPAKTKIISRQESYHGGTMAATAITGMAPFHRGFGPEPPDFIQVPTCYPYRCQWCSSKPSCTLACADNIEATIEREGAGTVAAVIAEPVHGAGGVIPPDPGYWPRLREICDRHGVLLIADEVITGFGRTGKWFALEHWGVQPDIMTIAKAVTSAYVPLSAFIVSQRVHQAILDAPADTKFMIGCTNAGHPAACAVALRNLQIFEDEDLIDRAERMGRRLHEGLGRLIEMPQVGNVRGLGLIAAVEVVADKSTRAPYKPAQGIGAKLARAMRDRGVVTRVKGESILFAPPLIVTEEQIDTIVNVTAQAIDATLGGRE
ncbi:MAG: aspartate aminotransferase family protein [Chloroflexota bacterium]|nr:aspartate aminotransferase family protein [Chloroflexota bacterium]